jgi:hypothetical protein
MNERILVNSETPEEAIQAALLEAQLPCARAFSAANKLGIAPACVGVLANELDIRISRCQLGLFGYGPKSEGKHRIAVAVERLPQDLCDAIRGSLVAKRLPCCAAWRISEELSYPRLLVSSVAENLGIRISNCQLGCF